MAGTYIEKIVYGMDKIHLAKIKEDGNFVPLKIMASNIKDSGIALQIPDGMESEGAPYGFAIMDTADQELLDMFNAGLANIKANGKYDEILAKYLGE